MRYIIALYEIDRAYGGAEEGGWWYDAGVSLESRRLWPWQRVEVLRAALVSKHATEDDLNDRPLSSVLSRGRVHTRLETHRGRTWPARRPHYE